LNTYISYKHQFYHIFNKYIANYTPKLKKKSSIIYVRYSSVSLSPTLGMNEKVEQHIINKIHKPNVLKFWIEDGVIPLYVDSCLIVWDLSVFPPQILSTSDIRAVGLQLERVNWASTVWPCIKSLLDGDFKQAFSVKSPV